MSTFNQNSGTAVPTLINSSAVLVTGNAASANALTVRQFGGGNVFSVSNASGGSNVFFMNNLGYVGLGTTGPSALLHVQGTTNIGGQKGSPSANTIISFLNDLPYGTNQRVDFEIGSQGRQIGNFGAVYKYRVGVVNTTTYGGGDFYIQGVPTNSGAYTSDGNAVTYLTVAGSLGGNVGVGTTNPSHQLTVTSNIYNQSSGGGFYGMNCGNLNGLIQGVYNGGSANPDGLANSDMFIGVNYDQQTGQRLAGTNHGVAQIQLVGANPGAGAIRFRCAAGGTGALSSVPIIATVTTAGVGIGTTSPAYTLDVSGAARVTSLRSSVTTSYVITNNATQNYSIAGLAAGVYIVLINTAGGSGNVSGTGAGIYGFAYVFLGTTGTVTSVTQIVNSYCTITGSGSNITFQNGLNATYSGNVTLTCIAGNN